MSRKPNKVIFWIGFSMIIIGVMLILINVFGMFSQTYFEIDTSVGSIRTDGLSPISINFIISGVVLVLLGLCVIYSSYKLTK